MSSMAVVIMTGNLFTCKNPGEHIGETDEHHQRSCSNRRFKENFGQHRRLQFPVDEEPNDDGVENGDHGGLGRGEDTTHDTAENDQRHKDSPKSAEESF